MEGVQRSTFPASLMDGMEFERQPVCGHVFFFIEDMVGGQ